MAKKNQKKARRNNTQAGRRVVNLYNHGTVNIDMRPNLSYTNKHENKGCTINYPTSDGIVRGNVEIPESRIIEAPIEIVESKMNEESVSSSTWRTVFKWCAIIVCIIAILSLLATIILKK